jgi:chemotaxis protein MotB
MVRGVSIAGKARRATSADPSGWLLTLSDCMLLLLTFFVMMFAMSSVKNDQWRDFAASVASSLRPLTALDPRALPKPSAEPLAIGNKRDVDYLAGLLGGMLVKEPALAGYTLNRTHEGLAIHPTSLLWQDGVKAPVIAPLGKAALALLVDRLRLVENTLVVRVHAPTDAEGWADAMQRGLALADALRDAGIGRETPVLAMPAANARDVGVTLLLRSAREGGP